MLPQLSSLSYLHRQSDLAQDMLASHHFNKQLQCMIMKPIMSITQNHGVPTNYVSNRHCIKQVACVSKIVTFD
ncbi:hypothetical protein TanjilG_15367 [Lupinus angustifolius]|uniref:Uncharacterized protein n=1 Tax=Lupinus angustifolius TaxID=3871 RepID=A0A1J7I6I8_LUPAN|nr:hypothetical protein TanjilG_15367 [Lupinus angustifolius]